jgi:hypothetical protein
MLSGGSRKRFLVDFTGEKKSQPLELNIDGQLMLVGGGKTHVNWKTGAFLDGNGNETRLTEDQLEHLRYVEPRFWCFITPRCQWKAYPGVLSVLDANGIGCMRR